MNEINIIISFKYLMFFGINAVQHAWSKLQTTEPLLIANLVQ